MDYRPEGYRFKTAENQRYIATLEGLTEAMRQGIILESRAAVCSGGHDLIVDLPCAQGIIPRNEGAVGISEGKTRDIALISRVGKPVCFKVTDICMDGSGKVTAMLSRSAAQQECISNYLSLLRCGDVIDCRVTHLEQFGAFVDIGCGVPSLIPIDTISVSRISHPSDRFHVGQFIRAVVSGIEDGRIFLTHKELLGTWEENALNFEPGETVSGIVRSVEDYGIFVELAPNLAGLAELRPGISPGQSVSVYIKAMIPEKMKIKLVIVDTCVDCRHCCDFKYYVTAGHIDNWVYTPANCGKLICTSFQ